MDAARSAQFIKIELAQILTTHFDAEELRTLCFHLDVEYDDLPAEGRANKARELIRYLDRRDRTLELIEAGKTLRPDIPWEDTAEETGEQMAAGYLPPKTYDHFTGRTADLEKVMSALREPERYSLITLYGLGGIGKTALAREAADLSLQEGRFKQVVWVSAKTEKFEGVGVEKIPVSDLTFDGLLDETARQCHMPNLMKQPPAQKIRGIQGLLATLPILIVADNLETAQDRETLVSRLDELLSGRSKALLTSRHEIKHTDVHALRLGGLSQDESILFLQEEGRSRGMPQVIKAPQATLLRIHEVTGGAPLAMKLVVGQLSRKPLEPVLGSLRQASFKGQDYEFYRFVFKHSWDMLTLEAKEILVSMSVFDPITGGSVQMVLQVSQVSEATFYPAMDELIAMSLVEFGGPLGNRRYVLHPLTHYFVLSSIVKMWG